jgi:threonine dehydratase
MLKAKNSRAFHIVAIQYTDSGIVSVCFFCSVGGGGGFGGVSAILYAHNWVRIIVVRMRAV